MKNVIVKMHFFHEKWAPELWLLLKKCDLENENFTENAILNMWISWIMWWKKCAFCQNLLEHLDTSFQLKQQYQMPQRQLDILKSWGHLLTRTKPIAQALRKKTHIKWQFLQCWLLWAQEEIFHLNKLTPKSWFGVLSCQLKKKIKNLVKM